MSAIHILCYLIAYSLWLCLCTTALVSSLGGWKNYMGVKTGKDLRELPLSVRIIFITTLISLLPILLARILLKYVIRLINKDKNNKE